MNFKLKKRIRNISKSNATLNSFYHYLSRKKTEASSSLSDEEFLKKRFKEKLGEELDLDNPKTINEKLQWLKLYDRKQIYTIMADKYRAKEYVEEKVGVEHVIPVLGVWDKFEDIDFSKLPDKFVLKCNHDCGSVVVCSDKNTLDYKKTKEKLNSALKRNYYYVGREWPYKDIEPVIFAEQYLENTDGVELMDYKMWCFNGVPKFIQLDTWPKNELEKLTIFDLEWKRMPFKRQTYDVDKRDIDRPHNLNKMIELAKELSAETTFLRVDLYEVNGTVFVGELTFFPGGGMDFFEPRSWERKLGEWLVLN